MNKIEKVEIVLIDGIGYDSGGLIQEGSLVPEARIPNPRLLR